MIIMLGGWAFELLLLDVNGTLPEYIVGVVAGTRGSFGACQQFERHDFFRDLTTMTILGVVLCASPAPRFSVSGAFGLLPIASGALVAGVIMYTKGGTQTFPIPFGTYSNCRDSHVG